MAGLPDLIVRDRRGRPLAIAEVKNLPNLGPHEAEAMKAQVRSYADWAAEPSHPVSWWLLLSQDRGFLWEPTSPHPREFSMREVVTRYLPDTPDQRHLRESLLERVVRRWLEDIVSGIRDERVEADRALEDAGFATAAEGGEVEVPRAHWSYP